MLLVIQYVAQLKMAAGRPADTVDLVAPQPVKEILVALAQRHGGSFHQLLLTPQGALQPALLLFLGDEQITPDAVVPRHDSDVLTVLSPMAGG